MSRFRIALAQAKSDVGAEDYDPRDANLARALLLIERAAKEKAGLVMFGEMYLSGYRTDEYLHKYATVIDPPDAHVQKLMERAKALDIYIVMGAATFGGSIPGDIYNSALVIGPEGYIGTYRKTHVAAFPYSMGVSKERCFYSPGQELPVFDTRIGRLGIHICYDMSFPEVARVQTLKGADILLNVSASAAGFEEFWVHGLFMRAVENVTWYVVCSVVGEQRGDVLFGGSRVVAPTGQVVAEGKSHEEDFIVAEIDTALSRSARSTSHTFNTRNPALYSVITNPTPYP
ncbi:MAG: carbon-nitrogen hydrolase family protein [Caldilineaceae bacterium]|nr:carbon-nitrogen hydrolase family protein [Caldilineaceae bacterium]